MSFESEECVGSILNPLILVSFRYNYSALNVINHSFALIIPRTKLAGAYSIRLANPDEELGNAI